MSALWSNCDPFALKLDDRAATAKLLSGADAVISALPFHCNIGVAEIAAEQSVAYFDLTEDVRTRKAVENLAAGSKTAFMPQCGLAPGFISIAAASLAASFEKLDTLKMRVGALPIYPSNQLKYNLTWSTEGLINEYIQSCEMIDEYKKRDVLALEGYERFSMDGVEYEAFNTSGGLGTLCDSLEGKVRRLDYKSVRYPGHRELISFLMHDLRFREDPQTLCAVFERGISFTAQDKVLVFVEARGWIKGRLVQKTYASTIYNTVLHGRHYGAIQLTTAAGICAPLDLFLTGKLKRSTGFLKSEDIRLQDFLDNDFGKHYRDEEALRGVSL